MAETIYGRCTFCGHDSVTWDACSVCGSTRLLAPILPHQAEQDDGAWAKLTHRVIALEQMLRAVTAANHAATHFLQGRPWSDCESVPCLDVRNLLGVTHEH